MELAEFNRKQEQYLKNCLAGMQDNWKNRSLKQYFEYFNEDVRKELISKLKTSKSILDVGCGFGYSLPELLKKAQDGATVVGVDIDPKTIKDAISHLKKQVISRKIPFCNILQVSDSKGVPTQVWRPEKHAKTKKLLLYQTDAKFMLKCERERFDVILSTHAYRYFIDKIAVLLRMLVVLKRGGDAYLLIDFGGILVFDEAPDVNLLHTLQAMLLCSYEMTTRHLIERMFTNKEYVLYDIHTFSREYLAGFELYAPQCQREFGYSNGTDTTFLKIHKKREVSLKGKLPVYHSFLINQHQNYKTISIYVKNDA